jgi:hypothetical protein
MRDVNLDLYTIVSITLYDKTYEDGYTEPYGGVEYDQILAFEALEEIYRDEELVTPLGKINEVEDKAVSSLIGPKRLEITLRALGNAGEKKLVVTDVVPPKGNYQNYSISGREWATYQKKLDKVPSTLWATTYDLVRVDAYLGGGNGSATEHFTPRDQERAWAALEKMFIKFKPAEVQVLKNWEVDLVGGAAVDDNWGYGGEWYGPNNRSQHYTNRVPSHYAPKRPEKAHYRVAGDEVGAVIHLEQKKVWEEEGSPDAEQSLKEMLEAKEAEKKGDAGDTASDGGSSGGSTEESDFSCDDCGSDECHPTYCLKDFGVGVAGGLLIDGRFNVH